MNIVYVSNTYKPMSMPRTPSVYSNVPQQPRDLQTINNTNLTQTQPRNINTSRFNMNQIFAARGRRCG